jgi:hypothetical protein
MTEGRAAAGSALLYACVIPVRYGPAVGKPPGIGAQIGGTSAYLATYHLVSVPTITGVHGEGDPPA